MATDEQQIRDVIATWHRATATGDLPVILHLMAEDVVFLLPGQPPMRGRESFARSFRSALEHFRITSEGFIQELEIAGYWAYCWTALKVTLTNRETGIPTVKSGYTLSIFRRTQTGWVLTRDANMLVPEQAGA